MIFSWKIINNFLIEPLSVDRLCDAFQKSQLDIERIVTQKDIYKGFYIAEIISVTNHPFSDRGLFLCEVKTKEGVFSVVCGASNVFSGMFAIFCSVGTYVPGMEIHLVPREVRSVMSHGMLCSYEDLGLPAPIGEKNKGIIDLKINSINYDVSSVLHCDDVFFDVDIPTNRADLLSIYGLLRDFHSVSGISFRSYSNDMHSLCEKNHSLLSIDIHEKCLGFFYQSYVIDDLCIPYWIYNALYFMYHEVYKSSPHLLSSYITVFFGIPVYFYNTNAIDEESMYIGPMKETRTVLYDGKTYDLSHDDLVIRNSKTGQIYTLIGTEDICENDVTSFHQDKTTSLSLCAPVCDSSNVYITRSKHNFTNHYSYRSIRGMCDNYLCYISSFIGCILEKYSSCYQILSSFYHQDSRYINTTAPITISVDHFKKYIGYDIESEDIQRILSSLYCEYTYDHNVFHVSFYHDRRDITSDIALCGEIMRHNQDFYAPQELQKNFVSYSYQNHSHDDNMFDKYSHAYLKAKVFRYALSTKGYHECITIPFVEQHHYRNHFPIILHNPINAKEKYLRSYLLASLLPLVERNMRHGCREGFLFEEGNVFTISDKKILHSHRIAFTYYGNTFTTWDVKNFDFFSFKSHCMDILSLCNIDPYSVSLEKTTSDHYTLFSFYDTYTISYKDRNIGYIGPLSWKYLIQKKSKYSVFGCEIFLDAIDIVWLRGSNDNMVSSYEPYSMKNTIDWDFSFLVSSTSVVYDIYLYLRKREDTQDVTITDIYSKNDNMFSVSFKVIIDSHDRDTMKSIHQGIIASVMDIFSVTLG